VQSSEPAAEKAKPEGERERTGHGRNGAAPRGRVLAGSRKGNASGSTRRRCPAGVYAGDIFPVGYFEGIVGERGVAWRTGDALAIRGFVGILLKERARDHSTVSRTRRLIDGEIYLQVFAWVLGVLADAGLVNGKQIGINATTLEANTALRGIVRQGMKSATRRS
jgi:transposase